MAQSLAAGPKTLTSPIGSRSTGSGLILSPLSDIDIRGFLAKTTSSSISRTSHLLNIFLAGDLSSEGLKGEFKILLLTAEGMAPGRSAFLATEANVGMGLGVCGVDGAGVLDGTGMGHGATGAGGGTISTTSGLVEGTTASASWLSDELEHKFKLHSRATYYSGQCTHSAEWSQPRTEAIMLLYKAGTML